MAETDWLKTEAIPGKPQKVNAGGGERGRDAASSRGAPPSAHPKAVAVVAEGTAPGRWLPMEASELLGPGLVERLEQLATCPLCGGPFEDPVLLACEHSFCRACLARRWGTPPATGPETPPTACPCCGLPCPRRSLRSNVRLAVEVRISRGLREKLAECEQSPASSRSSSVGSSDGLRAPDSAITVKTPCREPGREHLNGVAMNMNVRAGSAQAHGSGSE